jgi:hypothetical protein
MNHNVALKYQLLFSNVLLKRLSPYVERVVGDCQCGFCKGRSTMEQILEKCNEVGIEMHHLFIDFKAAYEQN